MTKTHATTGRVTRYLDPRTRRVKMKAVYRHGYSPDLALVDTSSLLFKMDADGTLYLHDDTCLPYSRRYVTDRFLEDGKLVLLCPENY